MFCSKDIAVEGSVCDDRNRTVLLAFEFDEETRGERSRVAHQDTWRNLAYQIRVSDTPQMYQLAPPTEIIVPGNEEGHNRHVHSVLVSFVDDALVCFRPELESMCRSHGHEL